jgi:hypothetical protein
MKQLMLGAAAFAGAFTLGMAAPASAYTYIGAAHPCSTGDTIPTADSCAGYYEGNALGGSPDDQAAWQDAYTKLGLSGTPTSVFHSNTATDDNTYEFPVQLFGLTVIGIHWGGGNGGPAEGFDTKGGVTGFYVFNFSDPVTSIKSFFTATNSGYTLFQTEECPERVCGGGGNEVPEPSTWALMILGFGSAGAMLRSQRRRLARVSA